MHQEEIELDDWFELVRKSCLTPPVSYNGKLLPAFPPAAIQDRTGGDSGITKLTDAFRFYKECIQIFKELDRPATEHTRILDFGVGWGRISRFFLREMPLSNIHGIDVTPEFTAICRDTFQSENFFTCPSFPPTSLPDNHYDFIVGYSVFSHLSEDACMAWMKEFARILKPGGIAAITTRGKSFFKFCESQKKSTWIKLLHKLLGEKEPSDYLEALSRLFENFDEARAQYDRGEFVHSNVQGVGGSGSMNNTFYGETFIPESYARRTYDPILKLEKFVVKWNYHSQPIMFFRKI